MRQGVASALSEWDDFRLVLTVAQTGSFNRAATVLGLTQPTVSRRIKRLEDWTGKRLFDRTKYGATLTEEGRAIVDDLNVANAALVRAARRALGVTDGIVGEVKLAITDGLAAYWLPRFMGEFLADNPKLELQVITGSEPANERRGVFDMMVHYHNPADLDQVSRRLGTLHFMPYCSLDFARQNGLPQSVDDLKRVPLLDVGLYQVDKGTWSTRLRDFSEIEFTRLYCNSSAVHYEALLRGVGVGLLPTYASVISDQVVPIDVGLRFETPIWVSYRKEAARRSAVRTCVEFIGSVFDRATMPWFNEEFVHPSEFGANVKTAANKQ